MSEQKSHPEIAADITIALIGRMPPGLSKERLSSASEQIAEAYKTIYAAIQDPGRQ